jgi:cytochrome c oxidase cbb3-type subunit 1
MRPLHTSAVIFAFGGNALIATSFYVVQRTSRARLFGGDLAWFVFWGYQLFIVMAATGYLLGITQGREYAEPEWYVDLWLTVVWVAYLIVFLGTIIKRKEPHIYVANWFYLAFIVTIAMLHIVNNLAMPVSFLGTKSYSAFSGVQDALTQWWYGHNAVGFFLTAGFLGMMYYFVPKQANRPVYSYRLSIIHFWALIFLYIWAGPHHLHYTALPDWAQTLGMVFSIMLWMPSWGGMINGLMTLSGAWDKLRTDPIMRMMVICGGLLRHVDLRRSDDVDQGGQLAQPLHRLDHRSRALRRSGLGRHDLVRRDLLPGAEAVGPPAALLDAPGELALLARHARHRRLRGGSCGCPASSRA